MSLYGDNNLLGEENRECSGCDGLMGTILIVEIPLFIVFIDHQMDE